jgi:hypothetical protein
MLSPDQKAAFDKEYQTTRILYGVLLISVLMIMGFSLFLSKTTPLPLDPASRENTLRVFYGIGACIILLIAIVRRRLLVFSLAPAAPGASHSVWLLKYRVGYLVIWILSESISVAGLGLLVLGGSLGHAVRFSLISLLLMLIFYPRRVR